MIGDTETQKTVSRTGKDGVCDSLLHVNDSCAEKKKKNSDAYGCIREKLDVVSRFDPTSHAAISISALYPIN